jgi:hypothetical protein
MSGAKHNLEDGTSAFVSECDTLPAIFPFAIGPAHLVPGTDHLASEVPGKKPIPVPVHLILGEIH